MKNLVSPSQRAIKEYVQATKFVQHTLPATSKEQYVALEVPSNFPRQWTTEGFTHLHFGVVHLALTYHGRKGLPVTTRLALLYTRYKKYKNACIGTMKPLLMLVQS